VAANYPGILAAQDVVSQAVKNGQTPALTFFNPTQAAEVDAIAAAIIPTDDSPGAREAHCLYFIDRALSTFAKNTQDDYVKGLNELQAKTIQVVPGASKFSALTTAQQVKVLTEIEKTPFFRTVRTHTVLGFFSQPAHGGNYAKVGWKLIGYEDSLNHKPPFGYYDALEMKQEAAR
jgi:gluconate 2-dehydrogenase gamma chain